MTITEDSSISRGGGPQLLLFSLAGAGTAAGISLTRWLLTETGEIMLLFSDDYGQQHHQYCNAEPTSEGGVNENVIYPEEPSFEDIAASCTPSTTSTTQLIGQSLLTISSSPHLRSIPIFLILLSSTTFLIGILITQKQLSRFLHSISNYQERMKTNVISIVKIVFGEEVADELEVQQQQQLSSLGGVLTNVMTLQKQQVRHQILMKMDNLVMDEYVQWFVQNGVEMMLGLGGGIALYSLPEIVFSTPSVDGDIDGKKGAIVRQRLIHAADPWLERVLFQPGGMWDALPNGCRELLTTASSEKNQDVKKIKMIDDSLDTTQETLVGTEISAESVGSTTDNETDDDDGHDDEFASTTRRHAHAPPISSVEMKTTTNGDMRNPNETIGEALYATICDVVASNLTNAFQSKEVATSSSSPRHDVREEKDRNNSQKTPTPQEQMEKILHRTTIAATTIFLCQFLTSRSTRRSWMSAIKFLTSAGLFSTAISAGVASHLLRSSDTTSLPATLLFGESAIMTVLCSKIHDWIQLSSAPLYSSLPTSVHSVTSKMHVLFHRLRDEIKKNKRLQATVALMILYGVKQLPGRRRKVRSGGMRGRRV